MDKHFPNGKFDKVPSRSKQDHPTPYPKGAKKNLRTKVAVKQPTGAQEQSAYQHDSAV